MFIYLIKVKKIKYKSLKIKNYLHLLYIKKIK